MLFLGTDVHSPVAHRGSEGARSEEFGCGISDLRFDEGDSNIRNRREHEDQGSGVQKLLETAAELRSGGGQDDGNGHDLVQSGKSKGESRYSGYTIGRIDRYH